MLGICTSMQTRLNNVLKASQAITQNVTTNVVHVADVKWFNLLDYYTEKKIKCVIIGDAGTEERVEVIEVDAVANTLTLVDNVSATISTSDNPIIYRAPAYNIIRKFWIGDLSVVHDYPTVCIAPNSEDKEWMALNTTSSDFKIDLMIYYLDRSTSEDSTKDLLETTREVEETLMADLHLKIRDRGDEWGRVYDSRVSGANYGVTAKGSAFLKTAQISWFGKISRIEKLTASQNRGETPFE